MKANSRRIVLISSLAMLLVALVALSTATFAWFTNSTQATANGINVTANAAKGLQISTDGTTWGTNQTWAAVDSDTISPLSVPYSVGSAMPTSYYAEKAGVDGAWSQTNVDNGIEYKFAEKSIGLPTAYVNSDAYYLSYKVDAKVTGLAETDNSTYALSATVAYTGTGTDPLKDVIRVAIADNEGKVYGVYGDDAVKAITSTTPSVATTASPVAAGAIECGTVSRTARTLTVFIWIEGQDTECVDSVMNLEGSYKITFSAPGIAA